MNRMFTAIVLLAALVAYVFGYYQSVGVLVLTGALLELWFWVRFFAQRREKEAVTNQRA